MFSRLLVVAILATTACAVDDMTDELSSVDQELGTDVLDVCAGDDIACSVHAIARNNEVQAFSGPRGYGAGDLANAYAIPATGEGRPTIAIVVAFGYSKLEADLAVYRDHYNLPACTVANGCLRIVNSGGGPVLPPDAAMESGWPIETMLDVSMASAACPRCKLLVIQGTESGSTLLQAQQTAVTLGADVISNSWSTVEKTGAALAQWETYFDHPGVAIFAAAGDLGYNRGTTGPSYPATSSHVFSVGGTKLVRDNKSDRGFKETVWSKGGSSCSLAIAKPAYQTDSPCAFRASADLAAVADPSNGVAVFVSRNNGWLVLGGTSAATPLVAGIFASTGHGHRNASQLATMTTALVDVTEGKNGDCGNKLCVAEAGWDGPTGFGTPNATELAKIVIAYEPPEPEEPTQPDEPADDPSDDELTGGDGGGATGGCQTTGGSSGGLVGVLFAAVYILRRKVAKPLTA